MFDKFPRLHLRAFYRILVNFREMVCCEEIDDVMILLISKPSNRHKGVGNIIMRSADESEDISAGTSRGGTLTKVRSEVADTNVVHAQALSCTHSSHDVFCIFCRARLCYGKVACLVANIRGAK